MKTGKNGCACNFYPIVIGLAIMLAPALLAAQVQSKAIGYISPVPGSVDNTQECTIILGASGLFDVSALPAPSDFLVEGSQSGAHAGSVILSDDARTLIFRPLSSFYPGEKVSVGLHTQARTSNGLSVGPLEFSFTVSSLSSLDQASILNSAAVSEFREGPVSAGSATGARQSLDKVAADSIPATFPTPVVVTDDNPSPRDIFLGTFRLSSSSGSVGVAPSSEQYLTILDDAGKPVFYRKMPGAITTDFKVQPNGYLTYFDANHKAYFELDSTYAIIDSFKCANGYLTDNHELLILPNGHFLLLGTETIFVNMQAVVPGGNPGAMVIGNVIQELDRDRNLVFQWRTFDHFQITDATHENLTASTIDAVHANAIDVDTDGNLLLSSRHLDEITKINRQTGEIIWRLGGKNNQFTFTNDPIQFSHQHSIRRTPAGTLILYDDGNFHTPQFSRAVEYAVDESARTATQVWEFRHSPDIYAFAMGSVQRLPNGNTLIGWGMGLDAAVTEARPNGTVAFELRLPDSVVSYRALSFPWQPAGVVTEVTSPGTVPTSFSLSQNYPNPFNPSTMIQYTVPRQSDVSLKVYDVMGREIATLVDESKPAGSYAVRFDALRYASGVYFYRLSTTGQSVTKMMTLIK